MEMMTNERKMNLALEHFASGRFRETEAILREILMAESEHAPALHLYGVLANKAGQNDAAIDLMRRAIANSPMVAEYRSNLAVVLTARGRADEALEACREALEVNPNLAEAHYNLGNALNASGQFESAAAAYRHALTIKFDYPHCHNNLGNVLTAMGDYDAAVASYREALVLQPDYAFARSNLATAWRALGRLDESLREQRLAVEVAPTSAEIRSNLIWGLAYAPESDAREVFEEARRWDSIIAQPLRARAARNDNDRSPERLLRIGLVLPDLRVHPVASFVLPLVESRDRDNFHITCYSTNDRVDSATDSLRTSADAWDSLAHLSDEAAAQRIRAGNIDILIDLSAHAAGNRLPVFARRPAPVQATYLGPTGTTGLSTIDYRFTDACIDPPGGESFCSEQLLYLAGGAFCYRPLTAGPVIAELPAARNGYVTFGSFEELASTNEPILDLWARVLQQVPGSKLQHTAIGFRSGESAGRYLRSFADRGVDASRIELIARDASGRFDLSVYSSVDIVLDTFPHQGMVSTCEALWMGVPVLGLGGAHYLSRAGTSLLTNAGFPELVADGGEAYVQCATRLAQDLSNLAGMRTTMRGRMQASRLMDATGFIRAIESTYRDVWRRWCASH